MWDPIAYALGFLDCKDISARCMLSIFHFFATKTDASVLRMLNGSPSDRLLQPICDYITSKVRCLQTCWYELRALCALVRQLHSRHSRLKCSSLKVPEHQFKRLR